MLIGCVQPVRALPGRLKMITATCLRTIPPSNLLWRAASLGGIRPFFRCPGCGQPACLLYLAERCACRSCLRLAYRVCYESEFDQALRRAYKARERLGANGELGDPILRPCGMHEETYERLYQRAAAAAARVYAVIGQQFPVDVDSIDWDPRPDT